MNTSASALPDFRSREFLLGHVRDTMAFYHPRCIDPAGGFFQFFKDDGTVYDPHTRHLVSSTRFVFNYSMAWQAFGDPAYRQAVRHGIAFLRDAHRNPGTGGYAWVLHDGRVQDATNHCYGLAFLVLAYAKALEAGMEEARGWLEETWQLMEQRFWEPEHGLYADQATNDWQLSPYRGQNANMHACEAWLAALEASGEPRYLQRAQLLAANMTGRQAALAGGLVWEHYRPDWSVDWDYNRDDRSNIFRPWGFQPGHQVEWAKLLLILDRHAPTRATCRALGNCSTAPWRWPGTRAMAAWSTATTWKAASTTKTSTSGCRPRRWPPLRCWPSAPARPATGSGTTASGITAGAISSTTSTAPGTASSARATASSPMRRARPGKPTTTPWARATKY